MSALHRLRDTLRQWSNESRVTEMVIGGDWNLNIDRHTMPPPRSLGGIRGRV